MVGVVDAIVTGCVLANIGVSALAWRNARRWKTAAMRQHRLLVILDQQADHAEAEMVRLQQEHGALRRALWTALNDPRNEREMALARQVLAGQQPFLH